MNNIKIVKIDNTDVFIEDIDINQGKITVSNTYGYNYSHYWGSMGCNIFEFLTKINSDYFASKLIDSNDRYSFDSKGTFKNVREYIRYEIGLKWYEHTEFQKEMREILKSFQESCEDERMFVDNFFSSFVDRLDFYLIDGRYDRDRISNDFKNISEHWYFINKKESQKYIWLTKLHKQLIKVI